MLQLCFEWLKWLYVGIVFWGETQKLQILIEVSQSLLECSLCWEIVCEMPLGSYPDISPSPSWPFQFHINTFVEVKVLCHNLEFSQTVYSSWPHLHVSISFITQSTQWNVFRIFVYIRFWTWLKYSNLTRKQLHQLSLQGISCQLLISL